MSNAIELERVTKTFGRQTAVDALDLVVPSGSIYGFIGPNGSGKTTTLNDFENFPAGSRRGESARRNQRKNGR